MDNFAQYFSIISQLRKPITDFIKRVDRWHSQRAAQKHAKMTELKGSR
jgi:hypothetical protein